MASLSTTAWLVHRVSLMMYFQDDMSTAVSGKHQLLSPQDE